MAISSQIPERTAVVAATIENPASENTTKINPLNGRVLTAVTPRQAELVASILAIHHATKRWPSGLGVARAVGRNIASVTRRLRRLEKIGVVVWAGGDVRVVVEPDGVFLTLAEVRA